VDIEAIQAYLVEHDLDGWLMADFHGRNDIAVSMLRLGGVLTRRSFYFIPDRGEPVALVHAVETGKFRGLSGRVIIYSGYGQLEHELQSILDRKARIAMEYSPSGRLPYVGLVDAGTVELVRRLGVQIESSADLVASFQARLTPEQVAAHRIAARNLVEIKDTAFSYVAEAVRAGKSITEHDVCSFIKERFAEYDMHTASGPICAVDGHAGDPHYEPTAEHCAGIGPGQLVLIDMWARINTELSVYADITWMAYTGARQDVPSKFQDIFSVLRRARDAAVAFLSKNLVARPVLGCEVDDVCRGVIEAAGYGRYFTHRTGHSITTSEHGSGPNIDNLETEDRRKLQRGHLFSIEPGIYMTDCGFRTEINVLVSHEGCEVTTLPLQHDILPLL